MPTLLERLKEAPLRAMELNKDKYLSVYKSAYTALTTKSVWTDLTIEEWNDITIVTGTLFGAINDLDNLFKSEDDVR